jgi:outer membrane protein OmpA-like peptidoglycan-associated protein
MEALSFRYKVTLMKTIALALLSALFLSVLSLSLLACSNPQPGPDKTAAGLLLGAGWGAGAGAVVGNQLGYSGEGVAVGAGFGAVQGAVAGVGYDMSESSQLRQEKTLASLRFQTLANERRLSEIQGKLDEEIIAASRNGAGIYQVFFDSDHTNLRSGAIANLESIADTLQRNPSAARISVEGHTDDTGNPEYNERLAESRARTVASYLMARGISADQITVRSYGAKRPIASNTTETGRQLNRRVDVSIAGSTPTL